MADKIVLLQLAITWYKIRHVGGQAHYYSRTGILKQRDLNQWSLTCLCQRSIPRMIVNVIVTQITDGHLDGFGWFWLVPCFSNYVSQKLSVTPQNVILTQNVITIAAKCNTNTKCNNINTKCNKIINAKCNNFPTQNVITFFNANCNNSWIATMFNLVKN